MMPESEQFHRLWELLDDMMPGEWKVSKEMDGYNANRPLWVTCGRYLIAKTAQQTRSNLNTTIEESVANAEFIALARNLMPDLLAAAEERDRLREEHDHVCLRSGCMVTNPVRLEGGQHDAY